MEKLKHNNLIAVFLVFVLLISLTGCSLVYSVLAPVNPDQTESVKYETQPSQSAGTASDPYAETSQSFSLAAELDEYASYTAPDDVAAYLNTYQRLPSNFITKREAADLGWESQRGNLWDVTDELSIGGDVFGNREGLLPKQSGRVWYECDVNYFGGYRGAERIVYSNDGLIFYTDDHYQTFVQLY